MVYIDGRKVYIVALNIKSEETQKLAKELSKLTGETLTGAITQSIRERLDRVRNERGTSLSERLLKIGRDCATHLREPFRSIEHAELLYDEKGMPR